MNIDNSNQQILGLLNSSGFLLQLALEHSIPPSDDPDASVIREHPWKVDGGEGFIDLIVSRGVIRFIIECKRPKGGMWIFPIVKGSRPKTSNGSIFCIDHYPGRKDLSGFSDFPMKPLSPESNICVIRGQSDDQKPLLERLAFNLLSSTKAVAMAELALLNNAKNREYFIYIPIIVTSAELFTCEVDPSDIDLGTGTLDNITPISTPIVRFRKSLAFDSESAPHITSLSKANRNSERTVFVINSLEFSQFISDWQWDQKYWNNLPPWEIARNNEFKE